MLNEIKDMLKKTFQWMLNIKIRIDGIDSRSVYSTNETRIGTFIDGKPIYRKCFHQTITANVGINITDLHVKYPINLQGFVCSKYGHWWLIGGVHQEAGYGTGAFINPIINPTTLNIYTNAHFATGADMILVFDYTKTTD